MRGDKNAMEWGTAWMNHKEPPANKVGFMYMLRGDGGASNTDPYATKEEPDKALGGKRSKSVGARTPRPITAREL
jgi:hypothetical protein